MYHVIGTVFTAVILYLVSYFFYRIGFYSLHFHRKLWNSILATAFIVSALSGIFMALQINYKWNVPFVKSILKWHVEFGIGLVMTGIFHLIWHLSYFGKMFSFSSVTSEPTGTRFNPVNEININLFIIGFVSSSVQLLLIREMMNIAGGYELITGIFLGSWLIGSSAGVLLAGYSTLTDVRRINLSFSLSPLISLFLLFSLSRLFLSSGETPSFLISILYTLLVLIPFCLVSGFTFIKLISFARSGNDYLPGKSFSIETVGGIIAGICVSFLTADILNTYQLLLIIIMLANAYVYLTFYINGSKAKLLFRTFMAIFITIIILSSPDRYFRRILLPGIKITSSNDTPYGNITTGKYKGEASTYYNHRLIIYNNDAVEREEDIHYAMLQCESPEKVILISGSLQSHLPEILKYPVKKVIYIERDPGLLKNDVNRIDTLSSSLIIASYDPFRFIRNYNESVDAIILLVPPPSTLQLNRYYTTEFFKEVKKRLKPGGVFMCSPGPADSYLNKESVNLYSSIYNSISGVFKNVKPISGNKLYFIASDKELSSEICRLTKARNINNIYVSSDFMSDDLITKKSDDITNLIDRRTRQNMAAFPIACFHFQSYNFSKNIGEKIPALALLFLLFVVPVLTIRRRNLLMYFSASALAGFEIIVLLMLQLIIGNMYQLTGLILAGMMAGLALGAGVDFNFLQKLSPAKKGVILILLYIFFGIILNSMLTVRSEAPAIVLLIISMFLPAMLTGNIFRELTREQNGQAASANTYSADLAGSAFGFILVSGFTVPAFGIRVSIFLISVLIFAGILFGTVRNKY